MDTSPQPLSPDLNKVLLIHHKFLDRWLQPGGHWERDETDTLQAAQREAQEETGVHIARLIPFDAHNPFVPIHIETHLIPERKARNQPAHYHHDFRYVFVATDEFLRPQKLEVHDADWFNLDAPETEAIKTTLARVRLLLNS